MTARAALDPDTGWAPEALAAQLARLAQASRRFDAIVLALDGEAGNIDGDGAAARAEPEAASLAARWGTVLALAAAVAGEAAPARLWFVTRGAQHLPGDRLPADPALAPLAALGRTLSLEQPAAWGGCIDLDAAPSSLERAFEEIARDPRGSDDEIAYRAGQRYLPVLERVPEVPRESFAPSAEASYLVTGGTGGIGTVLVDALLARGAGRVVVLGRRDPAAPEAAAWLAERRRAAGRDERVMLLAADPADHAALGAALDEVRRSGLPLRGIFHAAGSNQRIALADLTREDAFDFRVYFSSVAGRWGTAQMAPYAMANRFLDTLAERREAAGRLTRSLAWGPWAEVGMMVRQRQQGFGALGLRALAPGLGLAALARSLGEPGKGGATWQIVDVDRPRYAEQVAVAKHLRPFAALSVVAASALPATAAGAMRHGAAPAAAEDFGQAVATLAVRVLRSQRRHVHREVVARTVMNAAWLGAGV